MRELLANANARLRPPRQQRSHERFFDPRPHRRCGRPLPPRIPCTPGSLQRASITLRDRARRARAAARARRTSRAPHRRSPLHGLPSRVGDSRTAASTAWSALRLCSQVVSTSLVPNLCVAPYMRTAHGRRLPLAPRVSRFVRAVLALPRSVPAARAGALGARPYHQAQPGVFSWGSITRLLPPLGLRARARRRSRRRRDLRHRTALRGRLARRRRRRALPLHAFVTRSLGCVAASAVARAHRRWRSDAGGRLLPARRGAGHRGLRAACGRRRRARARPCEPRALRASRARRAGGRASEHGALAA